MRHSPARPNFLGMLAALGYVGTLELAVVGFLQPAHTFFALQLGSPLQFGPALALGLASAAPALLLPQRIGSVAPFCAAVVYFVVLLPGPLLGLLAGVTDGGFFAATIFAAVVVNLFARRMESHHSESVPKLLPGHPAIYALLYGGVAAFILYMLLIYPGQLHLVALSDVYTLRQEATGPAFTAYQYVSGAFAGAVGPVALTYGLVRRQWLL
ncbi:MAG: hypothetical protein M3Z32_04690, partial [Acidobacteriota bacterium]|nr:hypothetical protein [Acidobacteriota bacterium]